MSGLVVGMTPDALTAPDATSPDVSASNAAPGGGASHADMLTQSEWTRRLVAVASVIVLGLSMLAIVGVMCYRVAVDGNAPLTNDITSKLMWIALGGLASMTAALFGQNNLLAKLVEKVVP